MTYPEIEVVHIVVDVILENAQQGKQMIIAAAYPPDCISDVFGPLNNSSEEKIRLSLHKQGGH